MFKVIGALPWQHEHEGTKAQKREAQRSQTDFQLHFAFEAFADL